MLEHKLEIVIHTVKIDKVKQIVDVESSGKSADEIDKKTVSFVEMQLKQEDQSCVHASIELHLHVVHVVPTPISIRCDSADTLATAYSQMYNGKSRRLGVRHIMIRELITNGVISIEFVRSQQNLADHLMKGLARDLVIKSAQGVGLKSN
ncbi:hypothetical protein Tco_0097712 [Tanacetum coccineum]